MLPPDELVDDKQNTISPVDIDVVDEPHMSHRLKEYQTSGNLNEISVTEVMKEPLTTLDDVFISVKTASSYHKSRLALILRTWFQLAKTQVSYRKKPEETSLAEHANWTP